MQLKILSRPAQLRRKTNNVSVEINCKGGMWGRGQTSKDDADLSSGQSSQCNRLSQHFFPLPLITLFCLPRGWGVGGLAFRQLEDLNSSLNFLEFYQLEFCLCPGFRVQVQSSLPRASGFFNFR